MVAIRDNLKSAQLRLSIRNVQAKSVGGAVGGLGDVRQMVKLKKVIYSLVRLDIASIIPKLVLRLAAHSTAHSYLLVHTADCSIQIYISRELGQIIL